jgi:tetratricopeptide (TPR) repeat protein
VSGPLFDQYRAALRRGHMSSLAGDLDDALEAYRDAARLVPERTLPLASQGTVLHRLDRWPEAAEVFDTALRLTPDDEATLRARATAREERGMHSGAAADLERLAFVLDVAGRAPEAANVASRANELDPTLARAALAQRLARTASPNAAAPAEPANGAPEPARGAPEAERVANEDAAGADGPVWPAADDLDVEPPPSLSPENGSAPAAGEASGGAGEDGALWPAIDLPTPPPPPMVGPPPDTEQLMAEAAALFDVGDTAGAIERMLTAVAVHRAAGRLDAALDVCFQLLAIDPGDPHVHLAIANLQLDRGWTPLAREKIDLLLRLTSLTGDTQAEADTLGLASERLRDEPVSAASRP